MRHPTLRLPTIAHRRMRAAWLLAVGASLALVLPSPAGATPASIRQLEQLPAEDVPSPPRLEPLRLDCDAAVSDATAGIRCRWSVPTSDDVTGVRLVRVVIGAGTPRATVFRTSDLSITTFADAPVRAGTRYAYAVQGVNAAGRVIASSRTVRVGVPAFVPPAVEVLRLECVAAKAVPGERSRVGCEWSLPADVAPRLITLWRSVDGAARDRVASFAAPFATSYRDVVPAGTSRVVYAVVGTDGDGAVVARSRPEGVALPDGGRAPRPTVAEPIAEHVAEPVVETSRTPMSTTSPSTSEPEHRVVPPAPSTAVPTTTVEAAGRPTADADRPDDTAAGSPIEVVRERTRRGGGD